MIEPVVLHRIRMSSIFDIDLLRVGPIWAVVQCWPEEAYWEFFDQENWTEAVEHYAAAYNKRIRDDRIDKIHGEYWDEHHDIIDYDELEKRYKEQYGEEMYNGDKSL